MTKKKCNRTVTMILLTGFILMSFFRYSAEAATAGWKKDGNVWYYYLSEQTVITGWKAISGKWYYFNSNGVMQTGWQKISGKWYYFNTSGAMITGWLNISGKWYYLDNNGVLEMKAYRKGCWLNGSGVWDTRYSSGTWKKNNKGWWYQDGTWYPKDQWLWIAGYCYYFNTKGYLVTGTTVKGYTVDSTGAWVVNGVRQTRSSTSKPCGSLYVGGSGNDTTDNTEKPKEDHDNDPGITPSTDDPGNSSGNNDNPGGEGSGGSGDTSCDHNWVQDSHTETVHHDATVYLAIIYENANALMASKEYTSGYYCRSCNKYFLSWKDASLYDSEHSNGGSYSTWSGRYLYDDWDFSCSASTNAYDYALSYPSNDDIPDFTDQNVLARLYAPGRTEAYYNVIKSHLSSYIYTTVPAEDKEVTIYDNTSTCSKCGATKTVASNNATTHKPHTETFHCDAVKYDAAWAEKWDMDLLSNYRNNGTLRFDSSQESGFWRLKYEPNTDLFTYSETMPPSTEEYGSEQFGIHPGVSEETSRIVAGSHEPVWEYLEPYTIINVIKISFPQHCSIDNGICLC